MAKKKTANKKAIKKAAKKKSVKKKSVKPNVLKKVKPEFTFIMADGERILTLKDLALHFDNLSDDVFYLHANEHKNDFANWIRECIGEIELADQLMGINTKNDTQLQILKHIVKSLR